MNKHTKLAIAIAPLLAVGGYILSDMYIEDQAQQDRIFTLTPESKCDVLAKDCVLVSGDLKINVYDENGVTFINSTYPLDRSTLFLVDENNNATSYPLYMKDSPYYWSSNTPLKTQIDKVGSRKKLRLIAQIKGGKYISEFYTQTAK
ncbi:hypothetical protein D5018_12875 [Parashewanella curva]|uniref:Uncharacterized protein n=1 Tax=Parashewanella curva TaxID=2338552 RepID=A0A3L8PXE5_9GAMM|nr:hypothetical protein [Parashewanella curva]RLV59303.1 hypothetical protein D5018_12875 [Parashewanella curva]